MLYCVPKSYRLGETEATGAVRYDTSGLFNEYDSAKKEYDRGGHQAPIHYPRHYLQVEHQENHDGDADYQRQNQSEGKSDIP